MNWLNFLKRKKNPKETKTGDEDDPFFHAIQEWQALWDIAIQKESDQKKRFEN